MKKLSVCLTIIFLSLRFALCLAMAFLLFRSVLFLKTKEPIAFEQGTYACNTFVPRSAKYLDLADYKNFHTVTLKDGTFDAVFVCDGQVVMLQDQTYRQKQNTLSCVYQDKKFEIEIVDTNAFVYKSEQGLYFFLLQEDVTQKLQGQFVADDFDLQENGLANSISLTFDNGKADIDMTIKGQSRSYNVDYFLRGNRIYAQFEGKMFGAYVDSFLSMSDGDHFSMYDLGYFDQDGTWNLIDGYLYFSAK